jgi:hypothetical protein
MNRESNRNLAVDMFRGLGLWILFLDHLEPNVWSNFTPAHFGFSDFAEIFIFLSGYITAGMYGRALDAGGAIRKLGMRMARLYAAHLATMVATFGMLGFFASRGLRLPDPVLYVWLSSPAKYGARTLALLYCPHWFSLLPLYIVLAPVTLLAVTSLRRRPMLTLAVSFAIWCIAQTRVADLPIMARGEAWYFHPLAWQFLIVIGASMQIYWKQFQRAAHSRICQLCAAAVILISFLLKSAALTGAITLTPLLIRLLAHDAGKAHFAPFRLVHFLSLVILVIALPSGSKSLLDSAIARLAIAVGRDSLVIYCITLPLMAAGNLLLLHYDGGLLLQLACSAMGLAVISGIAYARKRVPVKLQSEQFRK